MTRLFLQKILQNQGLPIVSGEAYSINLIQSLCTFGKQARQLREQYGCLQDKWWLFSCSVNEYWAALELLEPPTAEDGNKI